ncbi:hypothetical protein RHMOL_Rhmol08G0249000 [Rhododendron molle]|uniref:Uncharacterized protein n=1 Tax=Rhododendron molle TaxID=49168 RepID=A0ACC0MTM0_RHOML|nr:hypothetical protein RHMOL_Rhmol08G0249000 [Rhododendron molle]
MIAEMINNDQRQSGSIRLEDLSSRDAVLIRAIGEADRMVVSGLTDEGPPIQACGSAVAIGTDARHGQVVLVFIGNE